jgi:hypothetical protein
MGYPDGGERLAGILEYLIMLYFIISKLELVFVFEKVRGRYSISFRISLN